MPKYERLQDGVVVELVDLPGPIEGLYHPDIAALYQPAGDGAQAGWRKDGNSYLPPAPLAVDLYAYAADKRWRIETGGITVGGVPVATDDRSKTMIMGARIKADADPNYTVGWKTEAGFVTLNATQIVAISDAVLAHVDACFDAEAAVLAGIDAGNIATIAAIDAFDWPPN